MTANMGGILGRTAVFAAALGVWAALAMQRALASVSAGGTPVMDVSTLAGAALDVQNIMTGPYAKLVVTAAVIGACIAISNQRDGDLAAAMGKFAPVALVIGLVLCTPSLLNTAGACI